MQQRQAADAQRRAGAEAQRTQAHHLRAGQRHAFAGQPGGWGGGGLSAGQACAMFFGRC